MNAGKSFVRLSPSDLEHLLITAEKSLEIQTRSQFFLWSQGALQGFIEHEALWCGFGDVEANRLRVASFARTVCSPRVETLLTDPVDGLLPRLVDDWLRSGRQPLLLSSQSERQLGRRQLLGDLQGCGFEHALVHGVREIQGEHASFFLFAGLRTQPEARHGYLIELLMPYLHLALQRMRMLEDQRHTLPVAPTVLLSRREIQVLHWVKNGKTNAETGQILGISAPTVKNHLQKIMRKLNVTNRAQAVGKAATLRLLAHSDLG
jgi:transcriptional regulator EpsA